MSKTGFTYQQEQKIYKALKTLPDNEFDYPDYGGLPEEIFCVFSCDQVDYIQQMIQSDYDFQDLVDALSSGYDEDLDE